MEINGIAHIQITAGRYDVAREFYQKLLPFLGLSEVMDNEYGYYCVGAAGGWVGAGLLFNPVRGPRQSEAGV